tara:strand:+ start:2704 stop:2922 length:219 start_codon:yes stop_codon:yes gene_type:complete
MRKDKLVGKKVVLKNVFCMETINGVLVEEYKDVTGILEKIGPNNFFGWDLSATVNGQTYQIITLSQIMPIYK